MQVPDAFVVQVVPAQPASEITVADVLLGSFGLTGVLVLAAALLGGVLAFGLVLWNRRHPPAEDHLPSVSPFAPDARHHPTSQAQ